MRSQEIASDIEAGPGGCICQRSGNQPGHITGPSPSPSTSATPSGASSVPPVARSADPEQFARNVATTLFAWDTTTGLLPLDYTSTILAVGDPSGAEQAGLANDVAAYLPSRAVWPGPA